MALDLDCPTCETDEATSCSIDVQFPHPGARAALRAVGP